VTQNCVCLFPSTPVTELHAGTVPFFVLIEVHSKFLEVLTERDSSVQSAAFHREMCHRLRTTHTFPFRRSHPLPINCHTSVIALITKFSSFSSVLYCNLEQCTVGQNYLKVGQNSYFTGTV